MTTLANKALVEYLSVLFDLDDPICITNNVMTNATQTVREALTNWPTASFVAINAFKPDTLRADKNVGVFRNFFIEFDDGPDGVPLKDQRSTVEAEGMPFSTQVFSGGKSYHFVISLEIPLHKYSDWCNCSRWLYSIMTPLGADPACKNVARFTRVGGGLRLPNKEGQILVETRGRVSNDTFFKWLENHPEPSEIPEYNRDFAGDATLFGEIYEDSFRGRVSKETLRFATTGGDTGKRHPRLFKAACDLRDQRYPMEEAKIILLTKIRERYKVEERLGEMFKHVRTVEDAYRNYPKGLPRF